MSKRICMPRDSRMCCTNVCTYISHAASTPAGYLAHSCSVLCVDIKIPVCSTRLYACARWRRRSDVPARVRSTGTSESRTPPGARRVPTLVLTLVVVILMQMRGDGRAFPLTPATHICTYTPPASAPIPPSPSSSSSVVESSVRSNSTVPSTPGASSPIGSMK